MCFDGELDLAPGAKGGGRIQKGEEKGCMKNFISVRFSFIKLG